MEMLVLIDSNNRFVDWNRFFSFVRGGRNCTFCGSLYDVERLVEEDTTTGKIDYVVMSVGVNDLDTKCAEEVIAQMKLVIELIRMKHGQPKIIINEATPRHDDRDDEVKHYNELLKDYVDQHDFLFLSKQSKLRTSDWRHYLDEKHITHYAIPIFVASLKRTMRLAYGMDPNGRRGDNNNFNRSDTQRYSSDRGRGGRGGGRGRGGRGGRGGNSGRGGFRHGGITGDVNFDYRGEFEKFKTEMRTLVAGMLPVGGSS